MQLSGSLKVLPVLILVLVHVTSFCCCVLYIKLRFVGDLMS